MPARVRERLLWQPQWEGLVCAWSKNFIKHNLWRCDPIHSFDDLLQDAWLTFKRVEQRYPRVIEPGHFLALYKTAMNNEMCDKARYRQRKNQAISDVGMDASDYGAGRIGELTNNGYLRALVAEAPDEVKFALALFASEKTNDVKATKRRPWQKPQPRENLNMRLNRAFGFHRVKFDFSGAIRALLT